MIAATATSSIKSATPTTTITTQDSEALPTSSFEDNNNNETTDTDRNETTTTMTTEATSIATEVTMTRTTEASSTIQTETGIFASPTDNGVTERPNGSNDDVYNDNNRTSGSGTSNNKALGIGLGVGIGCIAALGLAGLVVHNRKGKENLLNDTQQTVPTTRWRPQSFMGVVASVVARLPRSPSQRSKASGDMLNGASSSRQY